MNDIHDNELKIKDKLEKEPTPVTVVNILGGKKNRSIKFNNLRALIDSGCSNSLADKKYANKLKTTKNKSYSTGNGVLKTNKEAEISLTLSEFSDSKIINWKFDITDSKDLGYDIIIGRDLMQALGISLCFKENIISWEGNDIPMRDFKQLKNGIFQSMK